MRGRCIAISTCLTHEGFNANSNTAFACVAHGVLDEVPKDLRDPDRIGADRDRRRRELDLEGEPFRSCPIFKASTDIPNQLAKLESLDLYRQLR